MGKHNLIHSACGRFNARALMLRRQSSLGLLVLGAFLLMAAPVWADTWDFSKPGGVLGTSQTYSGSPNGIVITAYGFFFHSPSNTPTNLYGKQVPGNETGLGIANDPLGHFEISSVDFVNLDLSKLTAAGITNAQLKIGSVQPGEGYKICLGNSTSAFGSAGCFTGNLDNTFFNINWTSANSIVSITASGPPPPGGSNDVLVMSQITTVPEPATLLLFGTGLLGLAGTLRRRLRK